MTDKPYDDTSLIDIVKYATDLINESFGDVLSRSVSGKELLKLVEYYKNPRSKGSLGNLLEEHYFFYKPNSNPTPDFEQVGMELKLTPLVPTKKGYTAGERLVITMIPYDKPIEIEFKGSHLESKLKLILMVWYERLRHLSRLDQRIRFVHLYDLYSDLYAKDLQIILEDYKIIVDKIISGNAHTISEGDTKYLVACTKGTTAEKSLQPQYYNPDKPAKRRAFSLKRSYMNYILQNHVITGLMNYDAIFSAYELKDGDFDTKVLNKINQYVGMTEQELYRQFEITTETKSKQINKTLVYKMLGVKTENAEEFQKANIVVKTIRVTKAGLPRESMSFPKIKILDFVQQDFEESTEYDFFESTRFLFVVFQESGNNQFVLKGAKFWNMPMEQLDTIGRAEWELYRDKFIAGVQFSQKVQQQGQVIIVNDLPKKSDTQIFHLRPHSSKSAYLINGVRYGNGTEADMDTLPNGDKMTHQCFWLNNSYVAEIIKDLLV